MIRIDGVRSTLLGERTEIRVTATGREPSTDRMTSVGVRLSREEAEVLAYELLAEVAKLR